MIPFITGNSSGFSNRKFQFKYLFLYKQDMNIEKGYINIYVCVYIYIYIYIYITYQCIIYMHSQIGNLYYLNDPLKDEALIALLFFFFFLVFLGPHLWDMKVPRLGVQLEL